MVGHPWTHTVINQRAGVGDRLLTADWQRSRYTMAPLSPGVDDVFLFCLSLQPPEHPTLQPQLLPQIPGYPVCGRRDLNSFWVLASGSKQAGGLLSMAQVKAEMPTAH